MTSQALLAHPLRQPLTPAGAATLPLAAVLGWMSVVVRPINYAYYAVLATPTFVLLAETRTGDWHLASVRIVDTLLGGAIALLAIALPWPTRETRRPGRRRRLRRISRQIGTVRERVTRYGGSR